MRCIRTWKRPLLVGLAAATLLAGAGCTPKKVVFDEVPSGQAPALRKPGRPPVKTRPAPAQPPAEVVKGPATSPAPFGERAVALARQQLGKMYKWGAQGPDRFDCSGLTYFVYGKLGVQMPRVSSRQAGMGREIPRTELRPGDMLYFNTQGSGVNHVGIYVGGSEFIHAPRKGMPVRKDSLNNGWWKQKFRGARRLKG